MTIEFFMPKEGQEPISEPLIEGYHLQTSMRYTSMTEQLHSQVVTDTGEKTDLYVKVNGPSLDEEYPHPAYLFIGWNRKRELNTLLDATNEFLNDTAKGDVMKNVTIDQGDIRWGDVVTETITKEDIESILHPAMETVLFAKRESGKLSYTPEEEEFRSLTDKDIPLPDDTLLSFGPMGELNMETTNASVTVDQEEIIVCSVVHDDDQQVKLHESLQRFFEKTTSNGDALIPVFDRMVHEGFRKYTMQNAPFVTFVATRNDQKS